MNEPALPSALNLSAAERPWLGQDAKPLWLLDPDCAFLNNGSFGATPRAVLDAQRAWQDRMERQLVRFLVAELPELLRGTAERLGQFLGTSGKNIVFVDNATSGVNTVVRSLDWKPGDELLFTSHGYGAVNKAVRYVCQRSGATPVEVHVPFPVRRADEIIDAVAAAITPRTRLAVLDHITSASGLLLPIQDLLAVCRARGVLTLVDGAHAIGQAPTHLDTLGADFHTGNAHKWLFAPKATAYLYVHPDHQPKVHPLTISWGWPDGFTKEFDWPGTRDWSNFLALGAALDFYHAIPVQDPDARRREYHNALAAWAAEMLEQAWDSPPTAPSTLRAGMATIALPGCGPATRENADRIHDALQQNHNIEVPVFAFQDALYLRISAQSYNMPEDYRRLREAIKKERG
jgi:isopenicillin-N epimerase